MQALVFGLFGFIVGSFLNVVILRKGVRSLGGRSSCMSCGKEIVWYDLVPVFSWLFLRGKCRSCGSRISGQYPLVEALTAALFAFIGGAPADVSPLYLVLFCAIAALLLVIAFYDFRHTIIPDGWVYAFDALAVVTIFLPLHPAYSTPTLGFLAGPLAAAPLFLLWLVSRGAWMGLGDVKLALGIGWLLGPVTGLLAIWCAFVLGAVLLLPFMFISRAVTHMRAVGTGAAGLTMKSEVPFGPFLIASCFFLWLLHLYGILLPGDLLSLSFWS